MWPLQRVMSLHKLTAGDGYTELWRQAAVELLAGSHALDAAADQPWLRDPGAGWFVMRDVAVALEAFLVLDARLEEVGLLTQHDRPWLAPSTAPRPRRCPWRSAAS